MRLNDGTLAAVRAMRRDPRLHYFTKGRPLPFPLPAGAIAAHIRGGDKATEMALVPAPRFVGAAADLIERQPTAFSRVLFVSADDPADIAAARAGGESRGLRFAYTHRPRQPGGHSLAVWEVQTEGVTEKTLGHLLQLVMALEADAWIGTRGSNWNRLIDELRCVWVDKCVNPYVEVGGPVKDLYDW